MAIHYSCDQHWIVPTLSFVKTLDRFCKIYWIKIEIVRVGGGGGGEEVKKTSKFEKLPIIIYTNLPYVPLVMKVEHNFMYSYF